MARWNERTRLLDHIHEPAYTRLVDPETPELFRGIFPYCEVSKIDFDHRYLPLSPPEQMLITDTTFRDGQQARPPYTVEQIVNIYKLLSRLSGPRGIIRQSEFFLYSPKDREAVDKCRELGLEFPEITAWVRASKQELKVVREMQVKETGILTSASDYHIFHKMGLNRSKAFDSYLGVVKDALGMGIIPRCHLEDLTRADVYGFVVPFVIELVKLSQESGVGIKVRLCDTLGYGVTYPGSALPRSVPRLVRALIDDAGMTGERLEWHGHNDFYKALVNGVTAWLYGCGAINSTLLGFGERTGNPPIEGLVIEYIGLTGRDDGMDTRVISEIAEYYEREVRYHIPTNQPFIGRDFNSTSAGIHVDGLLKNPEIYNIFDTEKILNRPFTIAINDKSGTAGIAHWINQRLRLPDDKKVDKKHPGVLKIHKWVMEQYDNGRLTTIGSGELEVAARRHLPQLFISEFDVLKQRAKNLARTLASELLNNPAIKTMAPAIIEPVLEKFLDTHPFIQFLYVINDQGYKITRNITNVIDKAKYGKASLEIDFSDREWFIGPIKDGGLYVSDFYTSRITGALCITVSGPVRNSEEEIVGVLGADIKFEELAKTDEDDDDE
jgi:isopropylmalate/homocitrate/citramalate synthase